MDKIKISISYRDREYSDALSKALLLQSDKFEICSSDNPPPGCLLIDESSVPLFQPVPAIIRSIMAMCCFSQAPAKPLEKVIFTAFTAGIGGGGLSTSAICFAKLNSRIFGVKSAFVSFDPVFRNSFDTLNNFDLKIIDSSLFDDSAYLRSALSDVDELVLDLPWGMREYGSLIDCCDRRIVISGFDEKRKAVSEKFYKDFCASSAEYVNPPENFYFNNEYDSSIDTDDVHSQLGKAMLNFMKEIKG